MANRWFNQFRLSLEKQVVDLYFKAAIGSTGAITVDAVNSKGIRSIVRNSAGKYTITLQDTYQRVLDFDVTEIGASGLPAAPNASLVSTAVTTAAAPTVVFQMSVGGVATDPDASTTLIGRITLSNTTAI